MVEAVQLVERLQQKALDEYYEAGQRVQSQCIVIFGQMVLFEQMVLFDFSHDWSALVPRLQLIAFRSARANEWR